MDLRRQLHEVLWARMLFSWPCSSPCCGCRSTTRASCRSSCSSSLAVFVVANVPSSCSKPRGETRTLAAAMVVVDLVLVTAAVIFTGGALSSVAVFYVWPIVLASLFLPPWAPYAAAARPAPPTSPSGCCSTRPLSTTAIVGRDPRAANWMLITVGLHVAAFLLIALLTGRSPRRSCAAPRSSAAPRPTPRTARRMQATNEQLRVDEREQPGLPAPPRRRRPHARGARADRRRLGHAAGFALVLNHNTGDDQHARASGPSTTASCARCKELGIVEVADGRRARAATPSPTRQSAACSRPSRRTASTASSLAPLEAKDELLGLVCLLYRPATRPCPTPPSPRSRALSDQLALVVRNIQYNEELRARTTSSRTSTSSRATSWPP